MASRWRYRSGFRDLPFLCELCQLLSVYPHHPRQDPDPGCSSPEHWRCSCHSCNTWIIHQWTENNNINVCFVYFVAIFSKPLASLYCFSFFWHTLFSTNVVCFFFWKGSNSLDKSSFFTWTTTAPEKDRLKNQSYWDGIKTFCCLKTSRRHKKTPRTENVKWDWHQLIRLWCWRGLELHPVSGQGPTLFQVASVFSALGSTETLD